MQSQYKKKTSDNCSRIIFEKFEVQSRDESLIALRQDRDSIQTNRDIGSKSPAAEIINSKYPISEDSLVSEDESDPGYHSPSNSIGKQSDSEPDSAIVYEWRHCLPSSSGQQAKPGKPWTTFPAPPCDQMQNLEDIDATSSCIQSVGMTGRKQRKLGVGGTECAEYSAS
ncbi:hypothetical protein NPIL_381451 [Nephila pilipes]|uniref:Uncharacterized protein n=1 Tax=Nephila pilipes TaxID=299642 RepID=A0A8X6UER6_NEPPI|nr:hypothetical protein NPIL_381451 [Nephila pilipes]